MRVINNYLFRTGTKIAFSDFPGIIHGFFSDNGFSCNAFLYYFDDLISDQRENTQRGIFKLAKDCPSVGTVETFDSARIDGYKEYRVSNIGDCSRNMENDLLPLMKKIHKSYGMTSCDLYYYDVDFFGDVIPWERDDSKGDGLLREQPVGSGIRIHRDGFDSYLLMSVDILFKGKVFDADPLAELMKKRLSGIKYTKNQTVLLSKEEAAAKSIAVHDAENLIAPLEEQYAGILRSAKKQYRKPSRYSMAPTIKKEAKRLGYKSVCESGSYYLEKRMGNGPLLCVMIDSGPSHFSVDSVVALQGAGYTIRVFRSSQTPTDQESFDRSAKELFDAVEDFEKRYYPEIKEVLPELPEWFSGGMDNMFKVILARSV